MISKVYSATSVGLTSERVDVECDAGTGMFSFVIVGLPDASVQESRERVRSAIKNCGLTFPRGRVTVNLAPADLRKEGPGFDLAIAIAILLADREEAASFPPSLFVGELSLDGAVRGVPGVLSACMMARDRGIRSVFVPRANEREAALVLDIDIHPVDRLSQAVAHVLGHERIEPLVRASLEQNTSEIQSDYDMAHVHGQHFAKRAFEIAAAGGHNALVFGPPGSGKTLLAKTMPSILPRMTSDEMLEVTRIYSAAGLLVHPSGEGRLMQSRPFRSPHHTSSAVALVGGGSFPRPGEISLAHRGVLFLDEFPEFSRTTLEALRQPLEDGHVTVSRSAGSVHFPARFMLVAAQNPCPCGYAGSTQKACICSMGQILLYRKRVSGPLLDRFDLFVEMPPIEVAALQKAPDEELSSVVRVRVETARARARTRNPAGITNAELSSRALERTCVLDEDSLAFLRVAAERFRISTRSYYRIVKVSRTIADLANAESITTDHVAEALQYREKMNVVSG